MATTTVNDTGNQYDWSSISTTTYSHGHLTNETIVYGGGSKLTSQ